MRLRIVEFREPNEKGLYFFIEEGKKIWELKTILRIPWPKIMWTGLKTLDPPSADKVQRFSVVGTKTFEEAMNLVDELKKQIPIYHRVL